MILVSVADLLPPLKRFVVRDGAEVRQEDDARRRRFAHVTFEQALPQGRARIASARIDPRRMRGD